MTDVPNVATSAPRHAELSAVTLCRSVATRRGVVPTGARGTIVHVCDRELAYLVEFQEPFETVATVEADAIAA